jgi:phytoene dehydrogenase-like protein
MKRVVIGGGVGSLVAARAQVRAGIATVVAEVQAW